jgi:RHH-type transcriptional regulator, rel operon repressor / antitoxin RelB
MSSIPMSLRLDDDALAELDALAKATERSRAFLAMQAIREFLRKNQWQVKEIEKGIAEADAGELISHEEIMARWGDDD